MNAYKHGYRDGFSGGDIKTRGDARAYNMGYAQGAQDRLVEKAKTINVLAAVQCLDRFVRTVTITGGIHVLEDDGRPLEPVCESHEWIDLADAYLKACQVLEVEPQVVTTPCDCSSGLEAAAVEVIKSWERGDLASAVRNLDAALGRADLELYHAKDRGRDYYFIFRAGADDIEFYRNHRRDWKFRTPDGIVSDCVRGFRDDWKGVVTAIKPADLPQEIQTGARTYGILKNEDFQ